MRFVGMNIKGNPPMKYRKVKHDLQVAKRYASVIAVQEFRWPWYWAAASRVLKNFNSYPSKKVGFLRPVFSGQAIFWRKDKYTKVDSRTWMLHKGVRKVSEDRRLRAVLLKPKFSANKVWYLTGHNVVGGDEKTDSLQRRVILSKDIGVLDTALLELTQTGYPIVGQLDANIHLGSHAYEYFVDILDEYNARIMGQHGVEFLFVINGKDNNIFVNEYGIIPTSKLNTDHEGRTLSFSLRNRKPLR